MPPSGCSPSAASTRSRCAPSTPKPATALPPCTTTLPPATGWSRRLARARPAARCSSSAPAWLQRLSAQAHPPLEAIVAALVLPLTAGMLEDFAASIAKLRFLVRLSFDRSPYLARTLEESFALFRPLLRGALPAAGRAHADTAAGTSPPTSRSTPSPMPWRCTSRPGARASPSRAEFEQFLRDSWPSSAAA